MSLPKKMTVSCSQCGEPLDVTVFESVNTDYSADVAEQIISGELFNAQCHKCGFVSRLEYDILYHDIKHGAMIWLLHNNTPDYEQKLADARETKKMVSYKTTRIVNDSNALREKVACLEKNRDDRIIELCKVFVACNFLSSRRDCDFRNAFYTAADKEYIFIYDTNGKEYISELNDKVYDYLSDLYFSSSFVKRFDDNFAIVDYEWAESVLHPLIKAEAEKIDNRVSEVNEKTNESLVCPQCKKELPKDSKFCQYCGNQIGDDVSLSNIPLSSNSYAPSRTTSTQSYTYTPTYTQTNVRKKEMSPKVKSVIIIAAIVFAIILIVSLANGSNKDSRLTPVTEPRSGQILSGTEPYNASEITITASGGSSCVVKLKTSSGVERMSFYVRAGDTVTVGVPYEYLYVYFASGDTWYGTTHLFGEDTSYSMDDTICNFYDYTWEYTLYPVTSGNFSETPISADEFN